MAGVTTLRDRQIASLMQMLHLNDSSSASTGKRSGEPVWKILVYDRVGQDILSPVLSVQAIRQAGVTLNILLHTDRETIPDVPAVYFCTPSEENVDRICRDLQNGLYGPYYLNFITPIPRQRIEDLANAAYQSSMFAGDMASKPTINKVYDQYVNFVCLESDFFVLSAGGQGASSGDINFYELNKPGLQDTDMDRMIDKIVDGLFSVFVTLGVVPVIRCPRANAAEVVAEKLDKKIRDNLRDPRNSLFSNSLSDFGASNFSYSAAGGSRPVLVIYDRGMDLATPLHHTWTYQALCHDVLSLNLNQIKFTEEITGPDASGETSESARLLNSGQKKRKTRTCDMDDRRDYFWAQYRGSPFPVVAEAIQTELEEYRKSEEEVKRLKQTMGLDAINAASELTISDDMLTDNTAKLTSAIHNLPQLLEKKKLLDNHTSIATAILHEIKSRKLDSYYELESKLMTKTQLDMGLNTLIQDSKMGTPEDKLRFFLIYYLSLSLRENESSQVFSPSELDEFINSLNSQNESRPSGQAVNPDDFVAPIQFVKRWISYAKMAASVSGSSSSSSSLLGNSFSSGSGGMKSNSKSSSMLSKWVNTGSNFLMEGVRNLVLKKQSLPLTRVVEEVMDGGKTDEFRTFDPKVVKAGTNMTKHTTFTDAIVFVVGGGNYIEYQNLQHTFKPAKTNAGGPGVSASVGSNFVSNKRVAYGCTNLCSADQFLKQLSRLGRES